MTPATPWVPLPRENDQCPTCSAVWDHLDGLMAQCTEEMDSNEKKNDEGAHVLGAILAWTVGVWMRGANDDPRGIISALVEALRRQRGIQTHVIDLSKPDTPEVKH